MNYVEGIEYVNYSVGYYSYADPKYYSFWNTETKIITIHHFGGYDEGHKMLAGALSHEFRHAYQDVYYVNKGDPLWNDRFYQELDASAYKRDFLKKIGTRDEDSSVYGSYYDAINRNLKVGDYRHAWSYYLKAVKVLRANGYTEEQGCIPLQRYQFPNRGKNR